MAWIEQGPPSAKNRRIRKRPERGPDRKADRPDFKSEPAVELGQASVSLEQPDREAPQTDLTPGRRNADRPLTISRRSITLWASGAVFLLIWAFILGVIVGRGTIFQNQEFQALEKRLSLSDPAAVTPQAVVPSQDAAGQTGDNGRTPPLTFYDSLAQSKPKPERGVPESGVTKVMPPLPKKPEPAPEPVSDQDLLDPDKLDPDAQPQAQPAADAEGISKMVATSGVKTVAVTESQAPPPKRAPGENFTVQVAISSTVERAAENVKKLKGQGFDAYYYQVENEGRRYFRIRVGRYGSRDQAQITLDRLAAAGHENMFISALTD
jgi:septal ring-binding cell division protein DamX